MAPTPGTAENHRSLLVYQTLPTPFGAAGIVLALVGSTLMVYADEKRGEAETPAVTGEPSRTEAGAGRAR